MARNSFPIGAKFVPGLSALVWVAGLLALAQTKTATPRPAAIAFVHVNVIPMDREAVLSNMTVLVNEGRIVGVKPAGKATLPEGTTKIDAAEKYLVPGLTDAHVHLQTPTEFTLFLANGVTTVFNLDGHPAHLLWRKRIESGEMTGPRIFTTGPIFTRPHKPDVAVRMVDEQAELGYDAVKIYNRVSKEEYPALIAEAKRKHLLLMGHIAREPEFEMTLAAGQSIAHLEEFTYTFFNPQHDDNNSHIVYDESKIPEAVQLTAKSGVFVTPTLSTYATIVQQATNLDEFLKNPDLKYDSPWIQAALQPDANRYKNGFEPEFYPKIRTSLALQRKLVKELEKAGVPLLCGTDASDVGPVAGFGIHAELQELVNDGLTPFQALQTATINAARYFGRTAEFGTVEEGKRADLVLLDGNPLADINKTRAIVGVVVNGRWISRNQLDRELSEVPAEYGRQVQQTQSWLQTDPEKALKTVEENDPYRRLAATALTGIAASQGIDKLRAVVRQLREKQPAAGLVSEESINALGYSLLRQKKFAEAVAVLRMNTQDFPKSANTWDSLGEALFKSGDTPQAVENYKKALETDPKYENAETARKFIVKYDTAKIQNSP